MKTILLLEDDDNLNRGISLMLDREGYHILSAHTVKQAEDIFSRQPIQMAICDITLPDGSGLDFGKTVRRRSDAFLIYLTALDQEIDIINGYDMGADDYITKPFSIAVLISKVNAFMKRAGEQKTSFIATDGFEISLGEMNVKKNGEVIPLSKTELQLFLYLLENAGQIVTKDNILDKIWDVNGKFVDDNTVTVNISRLKNKLDTDCICNVRGLGYLWTAEVNTY